MNQRRNRGGTFHRVRQPDVQRELRALANRAGEQQQRDHGDRGLTEFTDARENAFVTPEVHGAEGPEHHDHAEPEAEVADPVDDEGLLGGVTGRATLVVVADQQVRTETDCFPEEEDDHVVVGQHQHQHRKDEEREVGEEAVIPAIALHVADRIDVHQQADRCHDQQHDRSQLIGVQVDRHIERPGWNPGKEFLLDRVIGIPDIPKHQQRNDPGDCHGRHRYPVRVVARHLPPEQEVDDRRNQRQQGNQYQIVRHERFYPANPMAALIAQLVNLRRIDGVNPAAQRQDDRQTDSRFSRRDRDRKKDKNLAVE